MEMKIKRAIKAVKATKQPQLAQTLEHESKGKAFLATTSEIAKYACLKMPSLLGVEQALKQELLDLGFAKEQIKAHDGVVMLSVPWPELARTVALLNLSLRTAERVLINLLNFTCTDFTTLFNKIETFDFEKYLDDGFFLEIVGYSHDSQLSSVPALQRLIKKAIIKRLSTFSKQKDTLFVDGIWQENHSLGVNRIQFSLVKDQFSLDLDTSGEPLYKRGYRPLQHKAPIRETLAASILYYAHFLQNCAQYGECLFDPVAGSGTFVIEAALLLTKTAPGLQRNFSAENMQLVGSSIFTKIRTDLKQKSLLYNVDLAQELAFYKNRLFACDIDKRAIVQARENAKAAGVAELIKFKVADLTAYAKEATLPFSELEKAERVLIVANPPYGERLGSEQEIKAIHRALKFLCFNKIETSFKNRTANKPTSKLKKKFRFSVITSQQTLEKELACYADKRRKLYNGMLACTLYQYFRHE